MKKQLKGNKTIIIKSRKPIIYLSGMTGPILQPFQCNIGTVGALVNDRHEVYEIVNGKEILLTPRNYMNIFNDAPDETKVPETKVPETKVIDVGNVGTAVVDSNVDKFTGGSSSINVSNENPTSEENKDDTNSTEETDNVDNSEENTDGSYSYKKSRKNK